jgi:hypothetical protein
MNDKKYYSFVIFILCFPGLAQAYVDPGTGAYLLQLLIAVFGAAVFYISKPSELFKLIRNLFTKKNKK